MILEDKVVSVETAKKLNAAGFEQDTERYWANTIGQTDQRCWRIEYNTYMDTAMEFFSAPDAQEIGEYLPMTVKDNWYLEMSHDSDGYLVVYRSDEGRDVTPIFRHDAVVSSKDNEAEARALCWLWLKENNLI